MDEGVAWVWWLGLFLMVLAGGFLWGWAWSIFVGGAFIFVLATLLLLFA